MDHREEGSHIVWTRIDDRLIHGQVIIKWLRRIKHDRVVICDDQVAEDAFLQSVFQMAMPEDETLAVMSVDAFLGFMATTHASWRIFLLLKSPETSLRLTDAGVDVSPLNVGGMGAGPGTRRIYKSISLTEAQLTILRGLQERGVEVFFQSVPEPEASPVALASPGDGQ